MDKCVLSELIVKGRSATALSRMSTILIKTLLSGLQSCQLKVVTGLILIGGLIPTTRGSIPVIQHVFLDRQRCCVSVICTQMINRMRSILLQRDRNLLEVMHLNNGNADITTQHYYYFRGPITGQ